MMPHQTLDQRWLANRIGSLSGREIPAYMMPAQL